MPTPPAPVLVDPDTKLWDTSVDLYEGSTPPSTNGQVLVLKLFWCPVHSVHGVESRTPSEVDRNCHGLGGSGCLCPNVTTEPICNTGVSRYVTSTVCAGHLVSVLHVYVPRLLF